MKEMVETILTSRNDNKPNIIETFVDEIIDTPLKVLIIEIEHFAKVYQLFQRADKSTFIDKLKTSTLNNHNLLTDDQVENLMWSNLAIKVRSIAEPLHTQKYKEKIEKKFTDSAIVHWSVFDNNKTSIKITQYNQVSCNLL